MNKPNPRRSNGTKRTRLIKRVIREDTHCGLCGKPVDKTIPTNRTGQPYNPWAPEIDEIVPVSLGGDPFDRRNCRLTHATCNRSRGNGTRVQDVRPRLVRIAENLEAAPVKSSRDW